MFDLLIKNGLIVDGSGEKAFKGDIAVKDGKIAKIALEALEIDHLGLDNVDRRMLDSIIKYYNGGPVGLDTLAATVGEEAVTLEDVYEPYLMQAGFLARTPRGRCATRLAYNHLNISYAQSDTKNQVNGQNNFEFD